MPTPLHVHSESELVTTPLCLVGYMPRGVVVCVQVCPRVDFDLWCSFADSRKKEPCAADELWHSLCNRRDEGKELAGRGSSCMHMPRKYTLHHFPARCRERTLYHACTHSGHATDHDLKEYEIDRQQMGQRSHAARFTHLRVMA